MPLIKRAIVNYNRIVREQAAHGLADLLRSRGFQASAQFRQEDASHLQEIVLLEYPPLRGMQIKTWDEARQIVMDDMNKTRCKVVRLSDTAIMPTRGSPLSAGLDLCFDGQEITYLNRGNKIVQGLRHGDGGAYQVLAGGRVMLSTGLSIQAPKGCYARVAPRSGMSVKGFDVSAGVVDADYTGEIKVILTLHGGAEAQVIQAGDRVAQLVFEQCVIAEPVEVADLDDTERGRAGFGSTGG